jgi:RNA polymerase sigma-70 factor (ECF subfamily)
LIRFGRLDDVSIQESAGFDERESVHQALAMLRPEDQELLRLSEWEEMAPGDLAVIYKCSTNAVTIRLHRARRRLGQALQAVDVDTDSTTPGPPVARPERSP